MEPYEKQPKKLKRAFNVEQDRSYDIFDSKKRAWRIKERAPEGKVKKWATLDVIPSLSVTHGDEFKLYDIVWHTLPSQDGRHNIPDPVVLMELRQAKEDKSWVYIVCLYFEKVDSGTYLLSNHWEVRSYEFFSQDKKLANKLLVKIDWSRFFDFRDKRIRKVIKCKKMQRIIQDLQPRLNKIEGSVNPRKRKWTNGRDPTNDLIMHTHSWTNIRREGEFRSISSTYIAENDNPENDSSIAVPGADLTERYEIKKMLGEGAFGKVFQAYDRTEKTPCAIKVIRSVPEDEDAIRNELEVLQTLASNDKHNTYQCIHMRDYFHFRNHTCIVTDLYGKSMFAFQESNSFVPFPALHIQEFSRQLFTSVAFLHDLRIVHADLKPDNILLVNDNYEMFPYNGTVQPSSATADCSVTTRKVLHDTEIRIIDFGSAFCYDSHNPDIFTPQYRSPEHILNVDWSFPHDIWSIGCILVELWTGKCLFETEDDLVHLAMMETMWGKELDRELIDQATRYLKDDKLNYAKESKGSLNGMKKLCDLVPAQTDVDREFLSLLERIFVCNPKKRITAQQALQHPWFRVSLTDNGIIA
ncbi:hypothetical protein HBI56_222250 [Parastagonospora nodorum]|uniref:Protein kinase domain-containing protein n=1 Tax=Phaeosphaeria nodorum (strain SN15 / ATCC MYA-4574 / FGSC 10173) TaxID=321614 RepID=A0A7U2NRI3_PHANO|nr:hypothetical protein HBH56_231800 [Parastagonospora nodorum]QRD07772.1 hypothetical protein JI435_161750 [Parastagonospora nodorum SN15]KAH3921436.1 hypothetical protein HBH54_241280 [Parastagonospora nodorum]KAH3939932.1 hypothetical protein HBH53_224890 [Parastagonospora nodorum]KAH3967333.1 hypothetical protein HBH52_189970 [Parastagonospora nodorum]